MGLKNIPVKMLRMMAAGQRKPLGKSGVLPEEVDWKAAKVAEKKLQEQCESWLRRNNIFYLRMPMHRPTSVRLGWPDFTLFLWGGRAILVEIKVDGGRISEDQHILHGEYTRQTGNTVYTVVNYDQFVWLVEKELELLRSGSNGGRPESPSTSPAR